MLDSLEVIKAEQIQAIQEQYSISTNEEFLVLFDELKNAGLIYSIINRDNLYALTIMGSLFVLSTFMTIHLFIDKVFFKRFYESPNLLLSFRRGVMFTMLIIALLFMRIFAYWDFWMTSLMISLFIIIEIIIVKIGKSGQYEESVQLEDQEILGDLPSVDIEEKSNLEESKENFAKEQQKDEDMKSRIMGEN